MLQSPRVQYLLGTLALGCGQAQEARQHFERAAKGTGQYQIAWAYTAVRKLGQSSASEWNQKLQAALGDAKKGSDTSFSVYASGCIEAALGHRQQADQAFQQALLLPDQVMAHHLSRLARTERDGQL